MVVISNFAYDCCSLKLRFKLMIVVVFSCKMLREYYIFSFLVIKYTDCRVIKVFVKADRLLKGWALILILNLKSRTLNLVFPISNLK